MHYADPRPCTAPSCPHGTVPQLIHPKRGGRCETCWKAHERERKQKYWRDRKHSGAGRVPEDVVNVPALYGRWGSCCKCPAYAACSAGRQWAAGRVACEADLVDEAGVEYEASGPAVDAAAVNGRVHWRALRAAAGR